MLKTGLECGVQQHTVPLFEKVFERYPWDFIILSIHQVEDKEFWTQEFQRGRTQREYNERYYEEMLQVMRRYKDQSALGHLDLIARYDWAGVYPFEKVKPTVAEILRTAIVDGKGIEFNTSYRRYELSDTTPSREILMLYRDLGGEIITIGSDSHRAENLGELVREAQKILKDLGFLHFYTYEGMTPIGHRLCDWK